jgi:hypothetical protein
MLYPSLFFIYFLIYLFVYPIFIIILLQLIILNGIREFCWILVGVPLHFEHRMLLRNFDPSVPILPFYLLPVKLIEDLR